MARKNKSIMETFANASDNVRNVKDGFYKYTRDLQKKTEEIQSDFKNAKSKNKIDEDMERENKKSQEKAMARLQQSNDTISKSGEIKIDGEVIEVGGPINIDSNRKNFEQVGEFNDVKMKENTRLGDLIENWIKDLLVDTQEEENDEYQQYLAAKSGTESKQEKQVDVKKMRRKIEAARALQESFDTSESFNEKTKLYNEASGLSISNDNLTRVTNLGYIFSAYCGDLNAKNIVNEIKNNQSEIRMSNVIRDCLDGKISEEMMIQKLFAEIHGIDNRKLQNKLYSNETLVELCALQELSPNAEIVDFVKDSESQLKLTKNAILTNKTFADKTFLAEAGFQHNVNKTLETGDMSITPLSINGRSDGYIGYDKNINTDTVEIFLNKINTNEFIELGEANEHGLIRGNLQEITNLITSHDIGKVRESGLVEELEKKREITKIEALENKMTPEQKLNYQREVDEAVNKATAQYRRNFASGV